MADIEARPIDQPNTASTAPVGNRRLIAILMVVTWSLIITAGGIFWLSRGERFNPSLAIVPPQPIAIKPATTLPLDDFAARMAKLESRLHSLTQENEKLSSHITELEAQLASATAAPASPPSPAAPSIEQPELTTSTTKNTTQPIQQQTPKARAAAGLPERLPETGNDTKRVDIGTDRAVEESSIPPVDSVISENNALAAGLTEVTDRTVALEQQISQLQEQLKSHDPAPAKDTGVLVVAAVNLRDAVQSSQSFKRELDDLKRQSADDTSIQQDIAVLSQYSAEGVPTAELLQERFKTVADPIINASRQNQEDATLLDQAASRFSHIISIRKINADAASNTAADIVARTEHYLTLRNVKAAVAELQTLQEPELSIAKEWLGQATIFLESTAAVETIYQRISAQAYEPKKDTALETSLH